MVANVANALEKMAKALNELLLLCERAPFAVGSHVRSLSVIDGRAFSFRVNFRTSDYSCWFSLYKQ